MFDLLEKENKVHIYSSRDLSIFYFVVAFKNFIYIDTIKYELVKKVGDENIPFRLAKANYILTQTSFADLKSLGKRVHTFNIKDVFLIKSFNSELATIMLGTDLIIDMNDEIADL
ncbi:MAG: hypothetical protein ACRCTZ_13690 [Sarcina sp.]